MNKKSNWVVIVFKEIKITFVIKIGEKKQSEAFINMIKFCDS